MGPQLLVDLTGETFKTQNTVTLFELHMGRFTSLDFVLLSESHLSFSTFVWGNINVDFTLTRLQFLLLALYLSKVDSRLRKLKPSDACELQDDLNHQSESVSTDSLNQWFWSHLWKVNSSYRFDEFTSRQTAEICDIRWKCYSALYSNTTLHIITARNINKKPTGHSDEQKQK